MATPRVSVATLVSPLPPDSDRYREWRRRLRQTRQSRTTVSRWCLRSKSRWCLGSKSVNNRDKTSTLLTPSLNGLFTLSIRIWYGKKNDPGQVWKLYGGKDLDVDSGPVHLLIYRWDVYCVGAPIGPRPFSSKSRWVPQ